ncbi:SMI1/KNR4 family protein [Fictibacillus nanhaiensis]|nr:SMI1/KNR4 family protein [Fictibacillus nanhaiensis]
MKKVMDMIDASSNWARVSLLELKKTEKELGAIFPDEYKELFLETNGANFGDWTLFPIPTNEQSEFTMDIVKRNRENRPKNIPSDMICIGENNNGDKLCYRIRKRLMQEQIYLWDEKNGNCDCKASTLSLFIDWYVPKANTIMPKNVGTFTVESGQLIVTDPCYQVEEENELQIILSNVKKGKWQTSISYSHDKVVETLFVFYGEKKPTGKWHDCDKSIGVDSAQAGIFDLTIFGMDDVIQFEVRNVDDIKMDEDGLKYFVACCDVVASDAQGGVVPGGAVSMSGYGDGMYEVKVKYNVSKEVVGVMIDFKAEE